MILAMLTEAHRAAPLDFSRVLEDTGAALVALSEAIARAAQPFKDGKGCFDLDPLKAYAKPYTSSKAEADCGDWVCEAGKPAKKRR
jgi:hypothetical protein